MKTPQTKVWWVWPSLVFTLQIHAQSDWTDQSPHKSGFVTVNNVKLHYLDWGGKGDTLLFLHGMGATPHIYDELAPKFTNQFRVLGLTRRGHGQSEIPETGYDTATLVEDIRQFLDALKIQRVVLAGHSFAGDELTRFAVVHPDRVIKLIYFDSAYDHSRVPESLRFKPLHGGGPFLFPTKEESESLDGARRWISRLFGEKRGRAIYSMMEGTYSARAEYGKIKAPALAFFAIGYKKDVDSAETLPEPQRKNVLELLKAQRKYQEQEIEHFRREIPSARVVVLTNADHDVFIDRKDDVLREMRAFLTTTAKPLQISLPVPVDVQIPMPPTPVKADGKVLLVYELHVTNFQTNNLELVRVDVLRDEAKRPIATYTDEELSSRLASATSIRIKMPDQPEPRVISGGMRAIMYLLITVEREADVPAALHHRLFFKSDSAAENSTEVVEGAPVTVNRKAPLALSPPLRGEGWVAAGGPSNDNYHRRAIVVIGGKARIPQRFAIDWTRIWADGKPVHGERANTNFFADGAEVLAVADAVVADMKDGIPENDPACGQRAVPITLETVGGNYVILDLGKGYFAFYAHLQPKSIRVRLGERVRRGQVLALLGNSGNSESPHLHFHVTNGNSPLGAEGVPYVLESFEMQGILPSIKELGAWKPPVQVKADKRRKEIPVENAIVRFP